MTLSQFFDSLDYKYVIAVKNNFLIWL